LNKNAFALITWDEYGYPNGIYPLPAYAVEAVTDKSGHLFLKFSLRTGKTLTRPYSEILHLREDFNENDVFGERPDKAIESLMEILTATDQS
ncbi:phage portal protein, partial [Escherichia coli]